MVRTRIAPSPTGYPHIGTIYQALFDFAFAKKNAGSFIIRVEDTDRSRFIADAEEKLYAAIDWFNLTENESPRKGGEYQPYKQSERLELYAKYAAELVTKGGAYYCFCTKERLDEVRKHQQESKQPMMYDKHCRNLEQSEIDKKVSSKIPYVIRLKVPEAKTIVVKDGIRGDISFESSTIDDQVLLKSDGFPTYHLAVVVDDHLMQISHVVRGEEWITSTPKHYLLYDYFGWEKPLFYHTALIRNPDKSKLSKRHGHASVSWYQEEGFLPEAILNFLALLGWSHPEQKEDFTLDEFINLFELKDLKPVGPIFDLKKLEWLNGIYLRDHLSVSELKIRLREFYKSDESLSTLLSDENKSVDHIIELAKMRMKTLKQFKELVTEPAIWPTFSEDDKKIATQLIEKLSQVSDWQKDALLTVLKSVKEEGVPMKKLYLLLTGREQGLPLPDMMEEWGKDEVIARLNKRLS